MDLHSGTKRKRKTVTPGSEWSEKELDFFKIKIKPEKNFIDFFEEKNPDLEKFPEHIKEILNNDISSVDIFETIDWKTIKTKQAARFIKIVLAVTRTNTNVESAVDDLVRTIFEMFDYDEGDLLIRTREEIELEMCGSKTSAKPYICIETSKLTFKLLVQEDKSYQNSKSKTLNPEAQVIAEAIAAFQENNKIR
jgi:hypothetical protein